MKVLEYFSDKIENSIKSEAIELLNKVEEIRLRVRTTYSFKTE